MSKLVSRFFLCQIAIFSFVVLVSLVLLLYRPSLNAYVLTVLRNLPQTEFTAEIQQLERKNRVQENCRQMPETIANKSKRNVTTPVIFKVEDKHRVMYCDVPKVATTNLKGLLLILSGTVETDDLSSIPRLFVHEQNEMRTVYAKNLNETIINGVGNFTKFIFVRHPLERLVSAYQDKFVRNNTTYHNNVGKEIIRKYRKQSATPHSLRMGHDVTFPEFVSFIIDEWKDEKRPLDTHWRPVADLCLPCAMQFDFIGKMETLNQDVDFLLRKLNEGDLSRLLADQPKPKTTSSLWKKFMNKISYQQLSDLNRMFAEDFWIFGYPHYYTGKEPL